MAIIKKIWYDPVVSKVIATFICFIISLILKIVLKLEVLEIILIAILVFIVVMVVLILEIFQIKTKYKNVGIISIIKQRCNNNKSPSKITKKLENAKEIRIFSTTGIHFFYNNTETIKHAIEQNDAKVFCINANKGSKFLEDVAKMENEAKERAELNNIQEEIDDVEMLLNEINELSSRKNPVQIAHFDTEFRLTMILIKSIKNENWGWVTLTLPPFKSFNSIAFEVESKNLEDDNIYNQCVRHFDAVWKKLNS